MSAIKINEEAFASACKNMGIDKNDPNYRMFIEYYIEANNNPDIIHSNIDPWYDPDWGKRKNG